MLSDSPLYMPVILFWCSDFIVYEIYEYLNSQVFHFLIFPKNY